MVWPVLNLGCIACQRKVVRDHCFIAASTLKRIELIVSPSGRKGEVSKDEKHRQ